MVVRAAVLRDEPLLEDAFDDGVVVRAYRPPFCPHAAYDGCANEITNTATPKTQNARLAFMTNLLPAPRAPAEPAASP